ncbi:MAG: proton-translocating NADH-quinone oxidoreductase, chain [Verrucomicrobiales bacterium]|nr:proton-translocating NADH-quinone oxidoreductase, chain [Verrucomicrobiales bacterium]
MNASLIILELAVLILGLTLLLLDLWTDARHKPFLGYGAAAGLAVILAYSFYRFPGTEVAYAFGPDATHGPYLVDGLSLFFKRFFLLAAIIVLIISVEFSDRIEAGITEFYSLIVFALAGMMFAASANDFTMLFVSVEMITVTFYILTSFQRSRLPSLEAGIKYLILGALSTALTVYGIALVYGVSGTMSFPELAANTATLGTKPLFLLGVLLVVAGLGFKIAAFPLQIWAPDVYQGSPVPTTAFLAVGSKAAGFILLLRVLFTAVPDITAHWTTLLIVLSAVTILYGNLCAIPQRNLKRLLGYSSIAHAGYLLMGVAAMAANLKNASYGGAAILYYLSGYLFTVLGAFAVLCLALRRVEGDDVSALAGLGQRSPLLATAMTLAMVSLAGIPPLAGFFGKFLLIRAALEQGAVNHAYYWLVAIAIAGVVMSLYYYFGVIRAMYWSKEVPDLTPIPISIPLRLTIYVCMAGMLYLGLFPNSMVNLANQAASFVKF